MGLFNRSNKKSEREQKIKELVGGTLMSDSFKKKLESHGIKAVGLTSKGVELQRAFKLKIKNPFKWYSNIFLPSFENKSTNHKEIIWEINVETAAPFTPYLFINK